MRGERVLGVGVATSIRGPPEARPPRLIQANLPGMKTPLPTRAERAERETERAEREARRAERAEKEIERLQRELDRLR